MDEQVHIIACSVFKDAVTYLNDWLRGRSVLFTFLPSYLHLKPVELKNRLLEAVQAAKKHSACIGCLYGNCFSNVDRELEPEGVYRLPYSHCYELFIGRRRYDRLITARPGTFFVEKELLLDFDSLCRTPLELDDPEIRELYFAHYEQVVYIRQPLDPDLFYRAKQVAGLLELKLDIIDADYSELQLFLEKLFLRQRSWKQQP